MRRIILGGFILVLMLSFVVPCYCITESTANQTFMVNGNVTDVDSVGGIIVVRVIDVNLPGADNEMKFTLEDGATITKGEETIDLEDIDVNDPVTVEYYECPEGMKAIKIIDNNLASEY